MRKHYLDNIRWITVVLVVIYHILFIFGMPTPEGMRVGTFAEVQYQDAIVYFLYPWFMVLLFVVSGISSRSALEKYSAREFLNARTRKLLVPSTIGLLVFQWILGYVSMSIAGAFETIPEEVPGFVLYLIMALSGTGVLWFTQSLWIFSLILLLVHKFEKGKLFERTEGFNLVALIILVVPLWLSAQILNGPITVYRFGIYGLAFFIGYFILAHEEVIEKLVKVWLPLAIVAVGTGIAYSVYYFGKDYAAKPILNNPFSIAYAWIMTLAILAVMKKFGNKKTAFTSWMSKKSFGLYVFHYLPMSATAYFICAKNEMSAIPSYLITTIAAFAGGWILYEVISRIPVIRWCVLGVKKRGKKDVSR